MTRLTTSFVLGFHGCDEDVGRRAIVEGVRLIKSEKDYDWRGPGSYFWESDPVRALEWATVRVERGDYARPFVIGAVIDLRNCLDLVVRENLELVRGAYDSFIEMQQKGGLPVPENRRLGSGDTDRRLRYLDCAVIRHLHRSLEGSSLPYDTVRGMFTEGEQLYPGSGFARQSHVQIAVRNDDCIRGLFLPSPYPRLHAKGRGVW